MPEPIHILPLEVDHIATVYRLRLDQWEHLRTPWVQGSANYNEWFQRLVKDPSLHYVALSRDDVATAMVNRQMQKPNPIVAIGGFTSIDWVNQSAEVSFLCNQSAFEDEALAALVAYGCNRLNLHRLYAETYTEQRQKLFERAGFEREGIKRDGLRRNQQWVDTDVLSLIR